MSSASGEIRTGKSLLTLFFYPAMPYFNVIMQNWIVLQLFMHYRCWKIFFSKAVYKKLDAYKPNYIKI